MVERRTAASSTGLVENHGGQAEKIGRPLGTCRQRFEESRPLRAQRVGHVDDVDPRLALERLQDRAVARHVAERGPRARLLELEDGLAHGLEVVATLGCGAERRVGAGSAAREAAEEGVHEGPREALLVGAVRGGELVEKPEEVLRVARVVVEVIDDVVEWGGRHGGGTFS